MLTCVNTHAEDLWSLDWSLLPRLEHQMTFLIFPDAHPLGQAEFSSEWIVMAYPTTHSLSQPYSLVKSLGVEHPSWQTVSTPDTEARRAVTVSVVWIINDGAQCEAFLISCDKHLPLSTVLVPGMLDWQLLSLVNIEVFGPSPVHFHRWENMCSKSCFSTN